MKLSKSSLPALASACLLLAAGCGRQKVERIEWPSMGTVAAVQTRGNDAVREASCARGIVQPVFGAVELRLNAHDPQSELSRLAACADAEALARCDAQVRPCYAAAFALAEASDGAFNPRWRGPDRLDLGAIAKGFAVDLVESAFQARPTDADCLVDLGGNIKSLRGTWRTGVMDPRGGGTAAVVDLREGEALATSATYYRGAHIRDGRTGLAVSNGVASVTVLCRSAMWADGLSTTLFVLGPEAGARFLDEKLQRLAGDRQVSVLWLMDDGRRIRYGTRFAN